MLRINIRLPPAYSWAMHERLRQTTPVINCQHRGETNFTANVLTALGAAPAMADLPAEAGAVCAGRSAQSAMPGTLWVLDPWQWAFCRSVRRRPPSCWVTGPRGARNASEVKALASLGQGGRGFGAVDAPEGALDAARSLARWHGSVPHQARPLQTPVIFDQNKDSA